MTNIYRDYYKLSFTKIYWSRLAPLTLKRVEGYSEKVLRCYCCGKHPVECKDKRSAAEYKKIQQFMDAESDLFTYSDLEYPIHQTGYIRVDQYGRGIAGLVWKIQRELAYRAGFKLMRSSFW